MLCPKIASTLNRKCFAQNSYLDSTSCIYGYLHLENTKDQRKTHWVLIQFLIAINLELVECLFFYKILLSQFNILFSNFNPGNPA